ncbi:hypothetical protein LCM17_21080 [Cereibacter sphaeroides]|nr:hypothetical protein [Cereibacter sphaeroides]
MFWRKKTRPPEELVKEAESAAATQHAVSELETVQAAMAAELARFQEILSRLKDDP